MSSPARDLLKCILKAGWGGITTPLDHIGEEDEWRDQKSGAKGSAVTRYK